MKNITTKQRVNLYSLQNNWLLDSLHQVHRGWQTAPPLESGAYLYAKGGLSEDLEDWDRPCRWTGSQVLGKGPWHWSSSAERKWHLIDSLPLKLMGTYATSSILDQNKNRHDPWKVMQTRYFLMSFAVHFFFTTSASTKH